VDIPGAKLVHSDPSVGLMHTTCYTSTLQKEYGSQLKAGPKGVGRDGA